MIRSFDIFAVYTALDICSYLPTIGIEQTRHL